MTTPSKGVAGVAVALIVAVVAGGILSRSLLHSGAASTRVTEAKVLVLFNQQRADHGLPPLSLDTKLRDAADSHSHDMLRRGYFAHDGPSESWDARIHHYVKRSVVAEILSTGTGSYATPSGMVRGWMRSSAHRRIILTRELRLVGIAIATGRYRGQDGVSMATADFSSG